ncbi:MAG TPA: hypothetical protein VLT51_03505 [Anaerolineales bacterium]|nr:hypothetical protein [Anaerolineales bacterium]
MNLIALRGVAGAAILFLGRELSFLFAAVMAAFIGIRLIPFLPASWPGWADLAFLVAVAVLGAVLTVIDKRAGYYVCGFLIGGFIFNEIYAPNSLVIPILPFVVGSVLGSVIIGIFGEWAMIIVACLIGTYLIYGVLPLHGTAKTLASAGIFVVGALAQVIIFQMQKHSDQ